MDVRGVMGDDGGEQALVWMSVFEGMNPVGYTEPLVFFASGGGGATNKTMTSVISFISKNHFFFLSIKPWLSNQREPNDIKHNFKSIYFINLLWWDCVKRLTEIKQSKKVFWCLATLFFASIKQNTNILSFFSLSQLFQGGW